MSLNENKESFTYTYSAKEQEEIKKIRERYVKPQDTEQSKMEQLRQLDASVTSKGTIAALIVGIIGTLIMGAGMSLIMTDFAKILGEYQSYAMFIGIVVGVVGMIGVTLALPVYNYIIKKERERIAPEIIRLTDELMK